LDIETFSNNNKMDSSNNNNLQLQSTTTITTTTATTLPPSIPNLSDLPLLGETAALITAQTLLKQDGLTWKSLLDFPAHSRLLATISESTTKEASSSKGAELLERRCGELWIGHHTAYRCRTCGVTESSCLCVQCFDPDQHQGHDWRMYKSDTGGCCDCGDAEAWLPSGWCMKHQRSNDPAVLAANADVLAIPKPLLDSYEAVGHHLIHSLRKTFVFGWERPWSEYEHFVNEDINYFLDEINSSPMKKMAVAQIFGSLQPIFIPIATGLLISTNNVDQSLLFLDISLSAALIRASSFLRPITAGKVRLLFLSLTLLSEFKVKFTHDFLCVFPFLVTHFVKDASSSRNNNSNDTNTNTTNNNTNQQEEEEEQEEEEAEDDEEEDGNEEEEAEEEQQIYHHHSDDNYSHDLEATYWDGPWLLFSRPLRTLPKMRARSFCSTMSHLWCQLFHNEETTLIYVRKSQLLDKMLESLTLLLSNIDLSARLFKRNLFSRIFSDIAMVISHRKISLMILENEQAIKSIIQHYGKLHGLDPQTRVDPPISHVLFEPTTYKPAWLLIQEFDVLMFPIWTLLKQPNVVPDEVKRHVLRLVTDYLLEMSTTTTTNNKIKKLFSGHGNTYSAHIPLSRLWVMLISYCDEKFIRETFVHDQDKLQLASTIAAEESIRVLGMMAQIEQKKWARNGQVNTYTQLYWYRVSRFWNYPYLDIDTLSLQVCALYGNQGDFSGRFNSLVKECGLERALKLMGTICHDSLSTHVMSFGPVVVANEFAVHVGKRALIHALAVKDLPFSEMEQHLDPREDKLDVRTILGEIADFKPGTPGVFLLKSEFWSWVDLLTYSRWGAQEEESAFSRWVTRRGRGNHRSNQQQQQQQQQQLLFPTIRNPLINLLNQSLVGTSHESIVRNVLNDNVVNDKICEVLERAIDENALLDSEYHGTFRLSLMILELKNYVNQHLKSSSLEESGESHHHTRLITALRKIGNSVDYVGYKSSVVEILTVLGGSLNDTTANTSGQDNNDTSKLNDTSGVSSHDGEDVDGSKKSSTVLPPPVVGSSSSTKNPKKRQAKLLQKFQQRQQAFVEANNNNNKNNTTTTSTLDDSKNTTSLDDTTFHTAEDGDMTATTTSVIVTDHEQDSNNNVVAIGEEDSKITSTTDDIGGWQQHLPECFSEDAVCAFCKGGSTDEEPLFLLCHRFRNLNDSLARIQERTIWSKRPTWEKLTRPSDFVETLVDVKTLIMDRPHLQDQGGYLISCGHSAHKECVEEYQRVLIQRCRENHSFEGKHLIDPLYNEWLCPLCRRICNVVEELHPAKEWQKHTSQQQEPKLINEMIVRQFKITNNNDYSKGQSTTSQFAAKELHQIWNHMKLLSWSLLSNTPSSLSKMENNVDPIILSSLRITTSLLLSRFLLKNESTTATTTSSSTTPTTNSKFDNDQYWNEYFLPMWSMKSQANPLCMDLGVVLLEWLCLSTNSRDVALGQVLAILEFLWPLVELQESLTESIMDTIFTPLTEQQQQQTKVQDEAGDPFDNYWSLFILHPTLNNTKSFIDNLRLRFSPAQIDVSNGNTLLHELVTSVLQSPKDLCNLVPDKEFPLDHLGDMLRMKPIQPHKRGMFRNNLISIALAIIYCFGGHDDDVFKITTSLWNEIKNNNNGSRDDEQINAIVKLLTPYRLLQHDLVPGDVSVLHRVMLTKYIIAFRTLCSEIPLPTTTTPPPTYVYKNVDEDFNDDEKIFAFASLLPPACIGLIDDLNLVIQLPNLYSTLVTNLTMGEKRRCYRCGTVPENPVLCLLCGELLCYGTSCCAGDSTDWHGSRMHDMEEVTRHSIQDRWDSWRINPNSTPPNQPGSIVCRHKIHNMAPCLFLKSTTNWLFCERGRVGSLGALYLDAWGEEDIQYKRGKPLSLSEKRLSFLHKHLVFGTFLMDSNTVSGMSLLVVRR
jgi:hypothetical protein